MTVGLSLLLASCVKPTVFPRYLTVPDVINNVKCELYMAILYNRPYSNWLEEKGKEWTAHFEITLQVQRQGSAMGDLTLVVPYDVGKFTLGLVGKFDKTGKSRIVIDFDAEKTLRKFMSKDHCVFERNLRIGRDLAGNTGIGLWFGNVIRGVTEAGIKEQSTGFTYALDFVTTLDGNIKPAFESIYPDAKIFKGSFDFRRNRQDTNTMKVVFAPYKAAAPKFATSDLGLALERIRLAVVAAGTARERLSAIDAQIADAEREQATARAEEKDLLERKANMRALLDEYESIAKAGEARSLSTVPSARVQAGDAEKAIPRLTEDLGAIDTELARWQAKARSADLLVKHARERREEALQELEQAQEEINQAARPDAVRQPVAPVGRSTEQDINQLLLRDAIRDIPR